MMIRCLFTLQSETNITKTTVDLILLPLLTSISVIHHFGFDLDIKWLIFVKECEKM